jgi:hypothetical protein
VPQSFRLEAVLGLAARARCVAGRGDLGDAAVLARRASELADQSDFLNLRARVWLCVAEVERAAGDPARAETAVETAIDLYEQKGNVAAARSVQARRAIGFRHDEAAAQARGSRRHRVR